MISSSIENTAATSSNQHDQLKSNYDQLLPGEGNLWGSILDSVSHNRQKGHLPTRKLIVLGTLNSKTLRKLSSI